MANMGMDKHQLSKQYTISRDIVDEVPSFETVGNINDDKINKNTEFIQNRLNKDKDRGRSRSIEISVVSNDRDKTPPRADKDRIRKNRKRKAEVEQFPIINGIALTDEFLDSILPDGFKIISIPRSTNGMTPPDISSFNTKSNGILLNNDNNENNIINNNNNNIVEIPKLSDLKDLQYFTDLDSKIFYKLTILKNNSDIEKLSQVEQLEIKCMKLILKIKNGSNLSRKPAMKNLTENAIKFGPNIIFNIILPLLSDEQLDEQSRHLLIKLIVNIMFKFDSSLIKPFTNNILTVTMPLLNDENKFTRSEGNELISKLSKIVGLYTMINILKKDLSNNDELTRNLISKTFAILANTFGIKNLLPFLKIVCNSRKNYLIRFTGIKIIQQISILMKHSIRPFINELILIISKNLNDEILNVRTITASTISSLIEACYPFGYESFQIIINPLFKGLRNHRGKPLSYFIKAFGNLIPLIDNNDDLNFYSFELFKIIKRESNNNLNDDEIKKSILISIEKICKLNNLQGNIIENSDLSNTFFKNFWIRRTALDKKIVNLTINACYSLSLKIGSLETIIKILPFLKDDSEPFRKMTLETCDKVLTSFGAFDLDDKTINRLIDGLLYCLQNQNHINSEKNNKISNLIILNSFGNIMNNLGVRSKIHLKKIISSILFRLKNKDPEIREQSADLIVQIVDVLKICNEDNQLIRLCTILYESLGEVYPDVLGSILNALRKVINKIDNIESLNPSIGQILSTLTPILKNRNEKVQEMTIPLIGDIAIRGKNFINNKEWLRISFELLEMLKAYRKNIRKSANKTFGLISKIIGPSDLIVMLLNNLKVQERQLRISTAVAIGIIAENCKPFTILPILMNEFRYPDKNVQNGVLKALSFMFEYIGEMGSDYIYAITPLLLDSLTDRDLVHRQISANVIKNIALGSYCQGYENAFINFLNLIWPNIFETSPHVILQIMESIECLNIVLGCNIILKYIWSGLFHPSRKVRETYWKIYNNIYIASCSSMVPYYPSFKQLGPVLGPIDDTVDSKLTDNYSIEELDLWV